MKNIFSLRISRLLISLATVFAYCFSQGTLAHTTIVPSSVDEGASLFADASISHGCDGKPVRAMAILFPSADSMLEIVDDPNQSANIEDHLTFGRHGSPRLAQDYDIYSWMWVADLGNTRSFHYDIGYLQTDLTGQVPFRFSAPRFVETSCAKQVRVLVPIVNWCSRSKSKPDRADVWMGRLTEKFNDPDIQPLGFWPGITVHRDMENNPLGDHCEEAVDLELSPTDTEIDELLPQRRYWPANVRRNYLPENVRR